MDFQGRKFFSPLSERKEFPGIGGKDFGKEEAFLKGIPVLGGNWRKAPFGGIFTQGTGFKGPGIFIRATPFVGGVSKLFRPYQKFFCGRQGEIGGPRLNQRRGLQRFWGFKRGPFGSFEKGGFEKETPLESLWRGKPF